jgi:hypothetical protein
MLQKIFELALMKVKKLQNSMKVDEISNISVKFHKISCSNVIFHLIHQNIESYKCLNTCSKNTLTCLKASKYSILLTQPNLTGVL